MNLRKTFAALAVASAMAIAATPAQAVTINFDDVVDGTNIASAYAGLGVTFAALGGAAGVFARSTTAAASPGNVVSVINPGFPAFDARFGMIEAVFSSLQRFVSIDAAILRVPEGLGAPTNSPRLEAYDSTGGLLAAINWDFGETAQPGVGGLSPYQTLDFTSVADNIARIRFFSSDPAGAPSNFGLFDNLVFTAGAGGGGDGGGGGGTVPEPGTLGLLAAALLGGLALRRQRH